MERYNRHIILSEVGQEGQEKLLKAKVLVVGAGGLGCPVLQYLTAAGIGTIGIIDFDVIEESNLQRQVLFGTSSIGKNKAIAAKERLKDLNPTITINDYPEKLTPRNALSLFENYDIIVDGTDNFSTRYLINDAAVLIKKPVVYAAIYKFEGQVSVFNYQNGPSYRCLFPNPPKEGSIANCSEVGVLGVLTGIIGSMQANEVIKIILAFKGVLSGKLFCYNAKTSQTTTIKIKRIESEFEKVLNQKTKFKELDENISCKTLIQEVTVEDVLEKNQVMFIDIRKLHEQPELNVPNCVQIPLDELKNNLSEINPNNTNIFVCQRGIRSKEAVRIAQEHGIANCYSLKGGISELIQLFKIKI